MDSNESSDCVDRRDSINFSLEPRPHLGRERSISQIPPSCLNPSKRQRTDLCSQCSLPLSHPFPTLHSSRGGLPFCSEECLSVYKIANRRTVRCVGCGNLKSVHKMLHGGTDRYFCSTECLAFARPRRGRPRKRGRVGRPHKMPQTRSPIRRNESGRNKSVQSEATGTSRAVGFSPPSADASTQTELDFDSLETTLLPIPIPIHQVFPMCLYEHNTPEPLLLPVPIPVPVAYTTAPPLPASRTPERVLERSSLVSPARPSNQHSLKYSLGLSIWNNWLNSRPERKSGFVCPDLMYSTSPQLCDGLCEFLKQLRKPTGEKYASDSVYYVCLGLQQYIYECGRFDNIFGDFGVYIPFTDLLDSILRSWTPQLNEEGKLICRIQEEHLWESRQLGTQSPHVVLNSILYFNTKHFLLRRGEDHFNLSFSNIIKQSRRIQQSKHSGASTRQLCLRYYPTASFDNSRLRGEQVLDQPENSLNTSRCPVRIYDFYLSKCPPGVKSRSDLFYLMPDGKSTLQSPLWFVAEPVSPYVIAKMLRRILFVKEIQEAFLGREERQ